MGLERQAMEESRKLHILTTTHTEATMKKYINIMFRDYDRCIKRGRERLCRNCSQEQRAKCQKKNA